MQTLKLLAVLLDYPEAEWFAAREELLAVLREDEDLEPAQAAALQHFIEELGARDLLDAQEDYGALFDRGRSLSLHLFEHVHGESRDRGQALVDLNTHYAALGLQVEENQLPDYLPAFLEFLSLQDRAEARRWLRQIAPILARLAERLRQRESPYAVCFDCLLQLSGSVVNREEIVSAIAAEKRDDTPEALDKIWQDDQILFNAGSANDSCSLNQHNGAGAQGRHSLGNIAVSDAAHMVNAAR